MSVVLEDDRLVVEAIKTNDRSAVEQVVAVRPGAAKAVDEQGVSVLMLARYYGRDEIAETLMKALPEINVFEVAAYDNLDRARELVSSDPSIVDRFSPDGFTPLQLASYFGCYKVASYLLEHGADVNAVAHNGSRIQALHSAVSNRHVDIVRLLLDSGANVNGRQESGYTPLHAAAANGDSEIVSLLLQFGADVNQVKSDDKAAADLALEAGHAELARRLRTSG